jgi:spore maturation protein A
MKKFTPGAMLNYIWFGIILLSVVAGTVTGKIDAVTEAAIESAGTAVELSIGLIGIMALWLGMMKIAEVAGLVASGDRLHCFKYVG